MLEQFQRKLGRLIGRLQGHRRRGGPPLPPDFDRRTLRIFERVQPYTMTTPERIDALVRATQYIVANGIPGEFVECGVWKGGSMMAVACTLLETGGEDRQLYLFDTFAGMTAPGEVDRTYEGESAAEMMAAADRNSAWVWGISPLEEVQAAMQRTGYDAGRMHFVKGDVRDTVPHQAPDQIALLRLDTDWYESTRHELEHLYARLSSGGVLIVDDYGHWRGARQAVDEFIEKHGLRLFLNRIDYIGRLAIKP